jgi:chromosome segregation ATPase
LKKKKIFLDLKEKSESALKDKDDTIESARNILRTLEDFVIKVEESRESARRAFELIPEILQKIKDAEAIVESLEDKLERSAVKANEAKEKSFKIKDEMENYLQERENVQKDVEKLSDEINKAFDDMKLVVNEENELSDKMDTLKKSGGEIEDLIDVARSKAERAKTKTENVHKTLDDAIAKIQELNAEIEAAKMIDEQTLDEFGKRNFAIFFTL